MDFNSIYIDDILKNEMWHPIWDGNSDLLYVIYMLKKRSVTIHIGE